jgi:hypothetical protein
VVGSGQSELEAFEAETHHEPRGEKENCGWVVQPAISETSQRGETPISPVVLMPNYSMR